MLHRSSSSPKPHTLYASTFFSMMHSSTAFKQKSGRFLISLPQTESPSTRGHSAADQPHCREPCFARFSFARNPLAYHVQHVHVPPLPSFYHERTHHHRKWQFCASLWRYQASLVIEHNSYGIGTPHATAVCAKTTQLRCLWSECGSCKTSVGLGLGYWALATCHLPVTILIGSMSD